MIMDFPDNNNGQNWFRGQFSGQMSRDNDSKDGGEYPTAIAVATFVIKSLEESSIPANKKTSEGPDTSLTKIKIKVEDRTTHESEPRIKSRKFSDEIPAKRVSFGVAINGNMPEKAIDRAPSIKKTPSFGEKQLNSTASTKPESATNGNMPEKAIDHAPSIKKTPSFGDKQLNSTASTKPESAVPKLDLPSTKQNTLPPTEIRRQSSTIPGIGDSKADVWEKAQLAKIRERYEKLSSTLLDWESKKKTKARQRMERIEGELNREKALRHYRSKMEMIDQIVGEARAQAVENRRNEELKVKEKANKIRSTGKLPATCFCF